MSTDNLPIRAFSVKLEGTKITLEDLGPSDCLIFYSDLPEQVFDHFTKFIKQPYVRIKAGIAPLELK